MNKYFSVLFLLQTFSLQSEMSIIGGFNTSSGTAYAALVDPSGSVNSTSLSFTGVIRSVSMDHNGAFIIGGNTSPSEFAYAAFVDPSGSINSLGLSFVGRIHEVSMNSSGASIIGGFQGFFTPPLTAYAAFVSPSGSVNALPISFDGTIESVSINSSGAAIIGGNEDPSSLTYAALVSASGSVNILPISFTGLIRSVSINDSGAAIIGGGEDLPPTSGTAYAALISSSGLVNPLSLSFDGLIQDVSLNNSGSAIIGGQQTSGTAYAALISPPGSIHILPISFNGSIFGVSINNSGAAIIGGQQTSGPAYAALISPSGSINSLNIPFNGVIRDVFINHTGAAIIGGHEDSGPAYAALVSPSGAVTPLSLGFSGFIFSVAGGSTTPILEAVVPKSYGPGSSFANAPFSLSTQILPNHLQGQRFVDRKDENKDRAIGMLADSTDHLRWPSEKPKPDYSIWIDGFGFYGSQKDSHFPRLTDTVGGLLIGFDYQKIQQAIFGGGFAYAHNSIHLHDHTGHAKVKQWMGTVYSSWEKEDWFFDAALWGGGYHIDNTRYSIANITSESFVKGWLLLPHLKICYSYPIQFSQEDQFLIEPFVMVDWVNNWQGHAHEEGTSGFNIIIKDRYTSILRTETGLQFVQNFQFDWGYISLQEKGSYVNKVPFHAGPSSTFFVGSASSFFIEMFGNEIQNLGAVQFNMQFLPSDEEYPYGSLNYQGEFGSSSFQSHLGSIELGKRF